MSDAPPAPGPAPDILLRGRGLVRGRARGALLRTARAFSFLGDVDIRSGRVSAADSDIAGRSIAGRVLVMDATRGSAGAWRFIYQLAQHGTRPAAIVTGGLPDPSVVQGAIMAGIPVLHAGSLAALDGLGDNVVVEVDGDDGCMVRVPDGAQDAGPNCPSTAYPTQEPGR